MKTQVKCPPAIKHPSFVAESLYQDFYLPEINLYSLASPLVQKDRKAPSSWFRARSEAVRQLSIQHFGLCPGTTDGSPRLHFRLCEWANHSNFAECDECRENRLEKLENIRLRRPASFREATRVKQVKHVGECHAERTVASDLEREASRNPKMVFAYSDKMGSHWNHLPIAPAGRIGKKANGGWK